MDENEYLNLLTHELRTLLFRIRLFALYLEYAEENGIHRDAAHIDSYERETERHVQGIEAQMQTVRGLLPSTPKWDTEYGIWADLMDDAEKVLYEQVKLVRGNIF